MSHPHGGFTIRLAEELDRESVQALYAAEIAAASWLPPEVKSNPDFTAVSVGETVVVCRDGAGELLGFVSVFQPESFIHHLYVAKNHQGRGAGTALLDSLQSWLPMPWRLKCVERNESALTFYHSRGWTDEDRARGPEGRYVLLRLQLPDGRL